MYVDVGALSGDSATLAFAFSAANANFNRIWDIKITQVFSRTIVLYDYTWEMEIEKENNLCCDSVRIKVECTNANA